MTHVLLPGLRLARRDAGHVQVGVDPPRATVLPDRPEVRRLLDDLAAGRATGPLETEAARALAQLLSAGLAVPVHAAVDRTTRLAQAPVGIDAPPTTTATLTSLLAGSGLTVRATPERATVVVVCADGELSRARLDPLVRAGTPHLVISGSADALTLGPFVVPGATACLRCVDAHRGETDPRRGLVIEQAASLPALTRDRVDPALHALALAWAVRDVVTFVEGSRPATWSATVRVDARLRLQPLEWLRHPHCGCSWGEALAVS